MARTTTRKRNKKAYGITLHPELKEKVDKHIRSRYTNFSQFVTDALVEKLEREQSEQNTL